MHLSRLELREFRNYERLALELPAGVVAVHGPNGAGKTNLLEGICVAAAGDSPRSRTTDELVRHRSQYGFVRADFVTAERGTRVEIGLAESGRRQIKIDGVLRRRADLIGVAPIVLFSASDIELLRGEPSGRRRLLDRELSSIRGSYYYHVVRYRRAIEQRNKVLKDLRERRTTEAALAPWDSAASRHGARLMLDRSDFTAALAPEAERAHTVVTGGRRSLTLAYRPSVAIPTGQSAPADEKEAAGWVEQVTESLAAALKERRRVDMQLGTTTAGPHRDDIEVALDGQSVRAYASQGEQRSCAVALRMGLTAVVRAMTGEAPLLLLDDVLSELDERHRRGVFAACDAEQVMVTCCDQQDIPPDVLAGATVLAVEDGRVISDCDRPR
jgi:DNA replication and repair protein RecF